MKTHTDIFTLENLSKVSDKLNKLPPIATEIKVYKEGADFIKNNIPVLSCNLRKEKINKDTGFSVSIKGINIVLIDYDDSELKVNQGKIMYSDGSNKIIDIYKL